MIDFAKTEGHTLGPWNGNSATSNRWIHGQRKQKLGNNAPLAEVISWAARQHMCEEDIANVELMALAPAMKEEILQLRAHNAKLDRFARLMMKTLEQIEECSDIPEHITDSAADILADWSEE